MKAVLATLCKGQPSKWPQYLKSCQRIINIAVHETTGEQPYFLMFQRRVPRRITDELSTIDQDANWEVALTAVMQTNHAKSRKYRDGAKIGNINQRVEVGQLVWVKRVYVTFQTYEKLGLKWAGPYKVKEVVRGGGAYVVESTFDGTTIRRAAGKIKPYRGGEGILVQPQEVVSLSDSDVAESETEREVKRRPVRECRPPRTYVEQSEIQERRRAARPRNGEQESSTAMGNDKNTRVTDQIERESSEEEERIGRRDRTPRKRLPVRRYLQEC